MTTAETCEHEVLNGAELAAQVVGLSEEVLDTLYERGVVRTPLEDLSEFAPEGVTLLSKNEGLQSTGAFKIRGATAALYLAVRNAGSSGETIDTVVTASDGNHGHGVRTAAAWLGLPCTVEMAETITPERQAWLRSVGANVNAAHPTFEAAKATAEHQGTLPGNLYIDPFDAVETMAGQASLAHEMLDDLLGQHARGEIDVLHDNITVVVPVAGGGMAAATASVFQSAVQRRWLNKNFRVIGAQMEGSDALARELNGDEPLTEQMLDKTCESTAVLEPGKQTKAILQATECFGGVTVVSRAEVGEAMLCLQGSYGMTEPAGALAFAGALKLSRQEGAPKSTPPDARRQVFITIRSGSDHITSEAFDAYAAEVDEATKQQIAVRDKMRRNREIETQVAAFQDLSRQAVETYNAGQEADSLDGLAGYVLTRRSFAGRAGALACWSGPTYQHGQGLIEPSRR